VHSAQGQHADQVWLHYGDIDKLELDDLRLFPDKLVIAENDATAPLRVCRAAKPAASDIVSREIDGAHREVGVSSSCGENFDHLDPYYFGCRECENRS
jgi:hypothetical protein